jgi:hypothetical protein
MLGSQLYTMLNPTYWYVICLALALALAFDIYIYMVYR